MREAATRVPCLRSRDAGARGQWVRNLVGSRQVSLCIAEERAKTEQLGMASAALVVY